MSFAGLNLGLRGIKWPTFTPHQWKTFTPPLTPVSAQHQLTIGQADTHVSAVAAMTKRIGMT